MFDTKSLEPECKYGRGDFAELHQDYHPYRNKLAGRSNLRLFLGLLARLKTYLVQSYIKRIARKKGAIIGKTSYITYELAKKANSNLVVGEHCCISTSDIDLRSRVVIEDYVMISAAVRILRASHNIDSPVFETTYHDLHIEPYVWLVGCLVLPRTGLIGFGAVCGAGSVIAHDVPAMAVMGGNPAKQLRIRKQVHNAYFPECLKGGDYLIYKSCMKQE